MSVPKSVFPVDLSTVNVDFSKEYSTPFIVPYVGFCLKIL